MAPDESPAAPNKAERPALRPTAAGLTIRGRIDRTDVAGLCDRARPFLEAADAEVIVCDVGALVEPDASAIDALARMQLAARRLGRRICLSHASNELQYLIALMGLREVVPSGLPLQPGREPEHREKAFGVEEEADPSDLPT